MRTVLAFARRELGGFVHSPIACAAGTVFLFLAGFFFRGHVLFYHLQSFQAGARPPGAEPLRISDGILRPFFGTMSVLVLLVLPFLAARLFAREKRSGSLALLLSYPIRPIHAVLGKFAGALLFLAVLLLASAVLPAFLLFASAPDAGVLAGGYAGLFLFGATFLALGLLASSLTASAAVAAIWTVGFFVLAWGIGWSAAFGGPAAGRALESISFFHRYARSSAGILEAGDALFFLAWIAFPLFLAARVVGTRGWRDVTVRGIGFFVAIGLLLAAAVVAADRHGPRIDITSEGEHALAPGTVEILARLDGPLEAIAFYRPGDPGASLARDLLERFAGASSRFAYSIVDPDRNPGVARALGLRAYGAIILKKEGRRETVLARDEAEIAAGVLRLLEKEPRRVRFLAGRGEKDPEERGDSGYSRAAERLRKAGLGVERGSQASEKGVHDEAGALVLAGPIQTLQPEEIDHLEEFVRRGGRLAVLIDPDGSSNINDLLGRFGIEAAAEVIVDPSSRLFGADLQVPIVAEYDRHDATRALRGRSVFPRARPLRLRHEEARGEIRSLFRAGPEARGEADSLRLARGTLELREGNHEGPLLLGAVVSVRAEGNRTGRLAVIGDSDFASNLFIEIGVNGDLFVDLIGWLARGDGPLGIRTRSLASEPLLLSDREAKTLAVFSLGIVPGAYLLASLAVLIRWRRGS